MKSKYSRFINIVSAIGVILYFVISSFYLYNLKQFPKNYEQLELKQVEVIQTDIRNSLDLTNESDTLHALDALVENNPVDILILNDEALMYQSSQNLSVDTFFDSMHKDPILFESQGDYIGSANQNYQIFMRVYHLPYTQTVIPFVTQQFLLLAVCFLTLIVCLFIIIRFILQPMITAKASLDLMKSNQFDEVVVTNKGVDTINESIRDVSTQIDTNLTHISREYTEYEKELEISRLHLDNVILVSRSFIHDLKTPLVHQILENELYSKSHPSSDTQEIALKNIHHGESLITQINDILKMMNQSNLVDSLQKDIQDVDINQLMLNIFRQFKNQVSEQHLDIDYSSEEKLILSCNEVVLKLLIHNIISNMVKYADLESSVVIAAYHQDSHLVMAFSNTTSRTNIDRMLASQNLFNTLESDESHKYSSRQGLFLIKDLADLIGAKYEFIASEQSVSIVLRFNRGGDYE